MSKTKEYIGQVEENIKNAKKNIIFHTFELHHKPFPHSHMFIDKKFKRFCIKENVESLKFFRKLKIFMNKNKLNYITKSEFIIFRDYYNKRNHADKWNFVK